MTLVLLLAIVTARPCTANAFADVVASPHVTAHFRELLRDARYGYGREEAAFLIRLDDDAYALVVWPGSGDVDRGRWEGAVPPNTVAIVHTHPGWLPMPSAIDRATSRDSGLPVYVVTSGGISRAACGEVSVVLRRAAWATARLPE